MQPPMVSFALLQSMLTAIEVAVFETAVRYLDRANITPTVEGVARSIACKARVAEYNRWEEHTSGFWYRKEES